MENIVEELKRQNKGARVPDIGQLLRKLIYMSPVTPRTGWEGPTVMNWCVMEKWERRRNGAEATLPPGVGPCDVWARTAAESHVWSIFLLQPGSAMMSTACVTTEGCVDAWGLGRHLRSR